ncbi:MAG: amino acid ABC transporter permease [Ancalomicrobiaceae bacterium]|nr:amino acid ABC transporter permease [Ancalomicrobiaceae bacterium]
MVDLAILSQALPAIGTAAVVTVALTLAASLISLVVGALSAAVQLGGGPIGYALSRTYVSLMRGTPLFVQLLVVYYGLPPIGIRGQAFLAAALAIGLNSGAYTTEILRAAILAVPRGQLEAATTIGLTWGKIWRRIVLPQAFVTSLPMLTAEFTIVLKSTPLASVIAVTEMTYTGVLIQSRTYSASEVFLTIAVGYILIAQVLMRLSRSLERRTRRLRF